jgi:hypothetical protein
MLLLLFQHFTVTEVQIYLNTVKEILFVDTNFRDFYKMH